VPACRLSAQFSRIWKVWCWRKSINSCPPAQFLPNGHSHDEYASRKFARLREACTLH
jgi:hypothetical protein